MYHEEKPFLKAVPTNGFRYFKEEVRTIDDSGLVQVRGSYYAALPGEIGAVVVVRIYDNELEIFRQGGVLLRRHRLCAGRGEFKLDAGDRIFNPTRESQRLMEKAERIGPSALAFAKAVFSELGRPGQRALYGLTNLTRTHTKEVINSACERLLRGGVNSYAALKADLARAVVPCNECDLTQQGEGIRPMNEYQNFWEKHAAVAETPVEMEVCDAHV